MGLNTIKTAGQWDGVAADLNNNFASITAELEKLKASNVKFKGYYTSELTLKSAYPSPSVGDNAWVGDTYPGTVYECKTSGAWSNTTKAPDIPSVQLADYAKKELVDSRTTEYNVSVQHPTSGTGGTDRYTLETAISQVPPELRNIGLKVSFVNSEGKVETWEFQGGTFTNVASWVQGGAQKLSELAKTNDATRQKIGVYGSKMRKFNWQFGASWYVSNGVLARYGYNAFYSEPLRLDAGTYTIGNNPGNVQCFLSAEYPDVGIKASMANLGQPITLLEPAYLMLNNPTANRGISEMTIDVYGNVMTEMLEQQRKDITETMAHTQRKISLVEGLVPTFNAAGAGLTLFVPLYDRADRELYIELPELYSVGIRLYRNGINDSYLSPVSERIQIRRGNFRVDAETTGLDMVFSHMGKAITEGTMLDISNVKLYRLDYVDTDIRNIIDGQITKDVKHRFTFNVQRSPYIKDDTLVLPSSYAWKTEWYYVKKGVYKLEGFKNEAFQNAVLIQACVEKESDIVEGCRAVSFQSVQKDGNRYIYVMEDGFIQLPDKTYSLENTGAYYIYDRTATVTGTTETLPSGEPVTVIDITDRFTGWFVPSYNPNLVTTDAYADVPPGAKIKVSFNAGWYGTGFFSSRASDVDTDKKAFGPLTPGASIVADFSYMRLNFANINKVTDDMIRELEMNLHVTLEIPKEKLILDKIEAPKVQPEGFNLDLPGFGRINIITDEGDPLSSWPVDKSTKHHTRIEYDDGINTFECYSNTSYQGSSSLGLPQKNFRLRLYSDDGLTQKKKVKFGSMIETNQFNLKAFYTDITQCKEPVIYRLWLKTKMARDFDAQFPWSDDLKLFSSVTGCHYGFPVEIRVNGEFYGLSFLLNKKDKDNYLIDSSDKGLLVCGETNAAGFWTTYESANFADEIDDEMSETTASAMRNFIEEFCAQDTSYIREHASERLYVDDWIDYYIFLEVFGIVDNYAKNLLFYSGEDKMKFSAFLYDCDWSFGYNDRNGVEYNALTMNKGTAQAADTSFFEKFVSVFWERIVERFGYLYNNGFINYEAVKHEFVNIQSGIPYSVFADEMEKWPKKFAAITDTPKYGYVPKLLLWYKKRIGWLKNKHFLEGNVTYF